MSRGPRSKYWCFTINNPGDIDGEYEIPRYWPDVKYCVWQAEVGESGTEHLQGYVVFIKDCRLSGLKRLCYEAHWEPRRGSHIQAKEYCIKKENPIDGPWVIGSDDDIPNGPGARTDLGALKADLDSKMPLELIADNHFSLFLRHERGIRSYISIKSQHRNFQDGEKPIVFVLTGPSGCGKSSLARQCFPNAYWVSKPNGTQQLWFDGYYAEEVIVFDEFYSWVPYDLLLRIIDFYPLLLPYKGGMVKCRAKIFVFTSNSPYTDWYSKIEDKDPLYRRLAEYGQVYHWSLISKDFERIVVPYFNKI
jgi:hypothetical protein